MLRTTLAACAGALVALIGGFSYERLWTREADPDGLPISCEPTDRDRCYQGGQRVSAPDPYEACRPPRRGNFRWRIVGEEPSGALGFTYVCVNFGE